MPANVLKIAQDKVKASLPRTVRGKVASLSAVLEEMLFSVMNVGRDST